MLMQKWLADGLGQLALVGPALPMSEVQPGPDVPPLVRIGDSDQIRVVPSFDARCRASEFWLRGRKSWIRDLEGLLPYAKVLHCSVSDVFRPMWFLAQKAADQCRVPSVMVGPDRDPHLILPKDFKGRLSRVLVDRMIRKGGRRAGLVLLKKGAVLERYGHVSGRVRAFCHSVHSNSDVISDGELEARLGARSAGQPIRAVYAGRFIGLKGLRDAIMAIAAAQGAAELDLYGSGPEEAGLRELVSRLKLGHLVRFHGWVDRGERLISRLARGDLLLYMPTEEDTPRMLYDAFAAGLPIVGTRIPFLSHHVRDDHCGELVPIGAAGEAGDVLGCLSEDGERLSRLSWNAISAGRKHSVEQWYRRRAEWTKALCLGQ